MIEVSKDNGWNLDHLTGIAERARKLYEEAKRVPCSQGTKTMDPVTARRIIEEFEEWFGTKP